MKKTIRNKVIGCVLAMAAMITTVITVPTETYASTEYTSITLTSENAYQAGLCKEGEEPTGDVVIPATFTYEGTNYKVTNIGSFCDNKNITSVEIPSTVKKIEESAFANCTKLKSVKMSKMDSIGIAAFKYCSSLKSVKMSKMDSIGSGAFAYCSSLKEVYINAKTVGEEAFSRCSKLSKVTFGDNVKKIGGACFQETAIKSINFGKNITEIGYWAVCGCNNLKSITIGEKVTKIGQYIDGDCKNVKTITVKSTKLKAKNCGIMGGPKGDMYLAPFVNRSRKETIKVPKSKLNQYKKFLGDGGCGTPIKYKAI